jgi:16S rRNA C967 or C1407 C5-methylase (RsmB/RsmF family)
MNIQRWIARRQPNWTRLALLLGRIEKKGLSSLNASEIREFGSLYRSVSGDLARAKTYQVGSILIQDLQAFLCALCGFSRK